MYALRHAVHTVYKSAAEYIIPPLAKSQFDERRVITPEEFVEAGDFLIRACPTWTWEGGETRKKKPFLPADKQYLVTRNVPCLQRAATVEGAALEEVALKDEDEGWVATHSDPNAATTAQAEHIPSIDDEPPAKETDEIPDMDEFELQDGDDEATLKLPKGYLRAEEPDDQNFVRTRTYDLYITYDQYYQVPRFWLVGYDESKQPLTPKQVMEDVSEEHARKTITIDPHPHLSVTAASIHPCKHSETMKRLVDGLLESGNDFKVEHYLVLFLKFIASVVPTIQYDYTMSVGN